MDLNKEDWEIEQDLKLNHTKDEVIVVCMELFAMIETLTKQLEQALRPH